MSTVPLSEAKNRLSELVESVDRTHERILITRNGRDTALLISVRDFESWEGTLELAMDPQAQHRVRVARDEAEAGQVVGTDELVALLESKRAGRR